MLEATADIPDALRIRIGVILKSYRDSLDHLAVALAEKNGAVEPRDVQFPIADSAARFLEPNIKRKLRRLSDADRDKITALRPYCGGNESLYELNVLANKDKHRKLLSAIASVTPRKIHGMGYVRRIAVFTPHSSPFPGHAAVWADVDPGIELDFAATIAFGELGSTYGKPVVDVLNSFSRVCSSVIDVFDPQNNP